MLFKVHVLECCHRLHWQLQLERAEHSRIVAGGRLSTFMVTSSEFVTNERLIATPKNTRNPTTVQFFMEYPITTLKKQTTKTKTKTKTGISAAEAKFVYETFREHDMDADGKISFGEMQNKFSMIQEGNMYIVGMFISLHFPHPLACFPSSTRTTTATSRF